MLDLGVPEPLFAFFYATRLGLSTAQSNEIIQPSMAAYRKNVIYNYGVFNEALKSLYPADVDPDLVVKALGIFYDESVWGMDSYLRMFADMITFGCPHKVPVSTALAYFATLQERGGKPLKMLSGAFTPQSPIDFEDSFFELNTPLEHAPQPYKKRGTFNDGMHDLERLVFASRGKFEEVAEGMWVFDPKSNVWYSLGGKTEIVPKAVRHKFVSYDISKLSDEPVLVHVHPEHFERWIEPPNDALAYPEYKQKITKMLSGTPSCADYKAIAEFLKEASQPVNPHAYIAHSLGVTEVKFPNDVSALESMGETSRDLRDNVLVEFDAENYHSQHGNEERDYTFVRRLMRDLNGRLPEGFGLTLNPLGYEF